VPDDLSGLPDDQLEELWTSLAAYREELRLAAKRVNDERNNRQGAAAARERLSAMTGAERAALAQIIQTEGIESAEAVNVVEEPTPTHQVISPAPTPTSPVATAGGNS
jgi:hypothetical protein